MAPLKRKAKQRKILIFNEKSGFLFSQTTMIVQASVTSRFLECYATSVAEHIVQDNNGHYWIRKTRQKTNNMCNIPLLDIPMAILKKYENHPTCIKRGVLLPVPCNQNMNSYLKEIADVYGIQKRLSTHVASHSVSSFSLRINDLQNLNLRQVTI